MAGYLEEAVEGSTQAWRNRDRVAIARVYQIEEKVNQAHLAVDAACLKLLATQQPLAFDLRFILSVIKINTDVERMVDQAVNIAHNAEYYLKYPPYHEIADLSLMADEVKFMVREAVDSFVKSDVILAKNVLKADDKVDNLKNKIFHDVLAHVKTQPQEIEQGLNVILIARNLERIGDHATNIAEDVIFTVEGKDIRHTNQKNRESGE